MSRSYPALPPVRVRAAGASHEGPRRSHNEDAFGFVEDATAALAVVADGMGASRSGRDAADLVIEICTKTFEDRSRSARSSRWTDGVLDELAEIWWVAEHGEAGRGPRRPWTTLPIADRAAVRDRVSLLVKQRSAEALGDVAVLEAEERVLLAIPERALQRSNASIHEHAERDPTWRGHGAAAVCVLFAAEQAVIAHVGDCRVSKLRRGSNVLDALTKEHTLVNDYASISPALTPEQLAEVPRNVITRALGMRDKVDVDTRVVPVATGDTFVLASDGLYLALSPQEIVASVRAHREGAARDLVQRGSVDWPDHPGDNLAVVVVEIA